MNCPGSVRLCESVVDAGSNDADRGTACHAILEHCLKDGKMPEQFEGAAISVGEGDRHTDIEVTDEMIQAVRWVLAWVNEYVLWRFPGSHLKSEERIVVGRAFGCPDDLWGTADVVLTNDEELCVADAKFGYNDVPIKDNPQLLLYLLGKAYDYGFPECHVTPFARTFKRYRIAILQPQSGEPKEQVVTAEQLFDAQRRYAFKIAATREPDAPIVPSDGACHWCAAAGVCPELHKRSLALAQREFVSVEKLSIDDLATLVKHADRIKAGLEAAQRHATRLALLGQKIPGFKLAAGDKRRVWVDEAKARKTLKKLGYKPDDFEPRSLITPAQAEKLIGKKSADLALDGLIVKPKGDPVLVPEDSTRAEIAPDFQPVSDSNVVDIPLDAIIRAPKKAGDPVHLKPGTVAPGVKDLL